MGNKSNSVYKNGHKGRAIIVPQVKSQDSFMLQAKRLSWIETLLEHIAAGNEECNKEDSAQWLAYYVGKHYDGSFTLASEALGLPLVQRLDSASTLAMWSDANINYTQQRIIKKHLRLHFGKRLFIPETKFEEDNDHYAVQTCYGEYKYYKNGVKEQKPERCSYWYRDPSLVVANELSRLIDYLDPNLVSTRFKSLLASGYCTIIAGADQGQGAWRSWIKISTMGSTEVRERSETEPDFDPKESYLIAQVGHINCKKDHHDILAGTVSSRISEGYEKLLLFTLVFVKPPSKDSKVQAVFIPKKAHDIKLEKDPEDPSKCHLSYSLHSGENNGFTMSHMDEHSFLNESKILLTIPSFSLFYYRGLDFLC